MRHMPDGGHSGYLVDPKSSQAVLRVLSQALGIEVDTQAFDEHAAEMGKVVAKLQEMQESMNRATKTCGILSDSPRSSTSCELLRGMSGIVKAEIYFDG